MKERISLSDSKSAHCLPNCEAFGKGKMGATEIERVENLLQKLENESIKYKF